MAIISGQQYSEKPYYPSGGSPTSEIPLHLAWNWGLSMAAERVGLQGAKIAGRAGAQSMWVKAFPTVSGWSGFPLASPIKWERMFLFRRPTLRTSKAIEAALGRTGGTAGRGFIGRGIQAGIQGIARKNIPFLSRVASRHVAKRAARTAAAVSIAGGTAWAGPVGWTIGALALGVSMLDWAYSAVDIAGMLGTGIRDTIILQAGQVIQNRLDWSTTFWDTERTMTHRQRALQAIQGSRLNHRSALGNEAALFHR